MRYHWLRKIGKKESRTLVLGHHTIDYLESIFIHWIRGGGLGALGTMPVYTGEIFRPLLLFTRKEIETILANEKWMIFEDESNYSAEYQRNRIRMSMIPTLLQEGLNPDKLYSNFHPIDEIFSSQKPIRNLTNIRISLPKEISKMELKTILDVYLKMMEAHPLTRKVLEEAYFQNSKEGQFLVENPEIMLWRGAKGPVYMIKKNSSLFLEPKLNSGELSWNRKSIYLDAGETLILDWKGRKIRTKQGHKEVSEVLRERNIPVPIRKYIPITEKDNRIYRILFQLWDEEMRDYREE